MVSQIGKKENDKMLLKKIMIHVNIKSIIRE